MTISIQDLRKTLFYIFIIVSLPIEYFYNLLSALGFAPRLPLFGYITFIHLASIPILIYFLLKQKVFFNISYYYILSLFLIQILIYTVVGFFLSSYSFNKEVLVQSSVLFYYLIINSTIGFGIYYYSIVGKKVWLYILYAYLISMIYVYITYGSFSLNLERINPTAEHLISYQQVSTIFLFTWYMYYSGTVNYIERLKSTLVVLVLFIASGSRSEFLGLIIVLTYIFALNIIRIKSKDVKSMTIGLTFVLLAIFFWWDSIAEFFINSRQFTLTKLDEDTSLGARNEIMEYNWQIIKDHLILGDYGSHFTIGKGYYIHNTLSAWQQYGLLGFILYILILTIPFIVISNYKIKNDDKSIDGILFITSLTLLLALASKSVYWDKVGFSIGATLYYYWSKRERPTASDR